MTVMPNLPLNEGFVRLSHAAELAARAFIHTTAYDLMDAFKRAIFTGEFSHETIGLQMEIPVPRCTLPPSVAAMSVRPRARYGANRTTVASVLLCADALPGASADWERLFDIGQADYNPEQGYLALAGIPFRDFPEAGRRELESLLILRTKLDTWRAGCHGPAQKHLGQSPALSEQRGQGRPQKRAWPLIIEIARALHRDHPEWQKKQLAYEAWNLARAEMPEEDLPSVATIQRDMVEILGGGSA